MPHIRQKMKEGIRNAGVHKLLVPECEVARHVKCQIIYPNKFAPKEYMYMRKAHKLDQVYCA